MFPPSQSPDDASERTLRDLLRSEGALSFERAARLLGDIVTELAALHARGAVHGAITPQSIRIDSNGSARLGPPSAHPDVVGLMPPAYLAPERIDGDAADARSDVYALGLVGWEMLAGETPFAADSLREVVALQHGRDLPRLTTLRPGVPRPLLFAIEGALHKQPNDRWANAGEMMQQLRQGMVTDLPSAVPLAPAVPTIETAPRRIVGTAPKYVGPADVPPTTRWRQPTHAENGTRWGRRVGVVTLLLAVVVAGLGALVAVEGKSKRTVAAPWIDSVTSSSSAGLLVTDDTSHDTAARLRSNEPAPKATTPARLPAAARDSVDSQAVVRDSAARDSSMKRADSARTLPKVPDTIPAVKIPDSLVVR